MTEPVNRRFVLASRPYGIPTAESFRLETTPIPEPGDGEALVRTLWLSVDPYMRWAIRGARTNVGEVVTAEVVGEVAATASPAVAVGQIVVGRIGWQAYGTLAADQLRVIDPAIAPIQTGVGILGMPGLTAYFGLLEVGRPRPGETVLVSGAAGAVGSAVGQIARHQGMSRGGHCRYRGQVPPPDAGPWLRRGDQLPHRRPGHRAQAHLSGRRGRVFRQRGRSRSGRGSAALAHVRPHRAVRLHFAVQPRGA